MVHRGDTVKPIRKKFDRKWISYNFTRPQSNKHDFRTEDASSSWNRLDGVTFVPTGYFHT